MPEVRLLRSLETLKVLADPRRLEILRLLMAAPATLTQLGRRMGHSAAWVSHHLSALEGARLVQAYETRVVGRATEKYYRAVSGGLLVEQLVLPKTRLPVIVFSGSHDPALQAVADRISRGRQFLSLYVGSLNGLTNLRQGICHLSGIHLLDQSGEYNRPFARHFFADREIELVTLAFRTQGLMVPPGNPKSLAVVEDLARTGIRFINRNKGSGTRLWLEAELHAAGIDARRIRGFDQQVSTHNQAAKCVKTGRADVALGLQAAAHRFGLDFVPLFEERYDLVLAPEAEKILAPMLDYIQTGAFRSSLAAMTGYNTAHSGELTRL